MSQYQSVFDSTANITKDIHQLLQALDDKTAKQFVDEMIQINGRLAEMRGKLTFQLMQQLKP